MRAQRVAVALALTLALFPAAAPLQAQEIAPPTPPATSPAATPTLLAATPLPSQATPPAAPATPAAGLPGQEPAPTATPSPDQATPGAPQADESPTQEPAPTPVPRTHDWRRPGFVGVVGATLYDPSCVPLRSLGLNAPNLLFRGGAAETLEWMRQHAQRWLRVFATGHAIPPGRAPRDAGAAAAALRALLARVQAFNAAHPPEEAIYVLVSLTDYYPPAVPGERFAYDHPAFRLVPVLPAPWYRAGIRQFDFEQEWGYGRVTGMPNYEVYFKPWVRQIVAAGADSPALMGWQLGNELKARSSPRNGISPDDSYTWYRDFTRDVVDTIRATDRNHLVVMGAQYIAELVDWEYRPHDTLEPSLVQGYLDLAGKAVGACGDYCWNLWGLTSYDFTPYAVDDALVMRRAGVASLITEYGFTRGTPEEELARYGNDRPSALREGIPRPWTDLDGQAQPRMWGARDLMERAQVAGIAAWGAPAPSPDAGLDYDSRRGITGAPDENALWDSWRGVAASLEAGNRSAGRVPACVAYVSP